MREDEEEYRAGELAPPEGREASGVEGGGFHQGHRGIGVCRRPRGGRPAQAEEGVRLERAGAQLGDARVCRGGHRLPESAATSGPRALDTCPHAPVRRGRADCGTSEDRAGKGRGGGGRGGGWRGEDGGGGRGGGRRGRTDRQKAAPPSRALRLGLICTRWEPAVNCTGAENEPPKKENEERRTGA